MHVWLYPTRNGNYKVFENENLIDKPQPRVNLQRAWATIPFTGENKRVRIFFYPTKPAESSNAKVFLDAFNVDASVDNCVSVKNCLDVLGDGSAAAYLGVYEESASDARHAMVSGPRVARRCSSQTQCGKRSASKKSGNK